LRVAASTGIVLASETVIVRFPVGSSVTSLAPMRPLVRGDGALLAQAPMG
jgi:hypothetical protein